MTVLDEVADHYNSVGPGLGAEFAREVRHGLDKIETHPRAWQSVGRRVRRYRIQRFPYGLVYVALPDEIVIIAVMHLSRRPGYWRRRLKNL